MSVGVGYGSFAVRSLVLLRIFQMLICGQQGNIISVLRV